LITKVEGSARLSLSDLAESRYIFPQFSCAASEQAWSLATGFRNSFERIGGSNVAQVFHCLTPDEMMTRDEFNFDLTKMTLFLRKESGLTGGLLRRAFLDRFNIQFNKTTLNTILLMVNAGSTSSSTGHLAVTLRRLAAEVLFRNADARKEALPAQLFKNPVKFVGKNHNIRSHYFRSGVEWKEASS
jgi:arginine/lysine/ornithine decarboxylase